MRVRSEAVTVLGSFLSFVTGDNREEKGSVDRSQETCLNEKYVICGSSDTDFSECKDSYCKETDKKISVKCIRALFVAEIQADLTGLPFYSKSPGLRMCRYASLLAEMNMHRTG